MNNNQITVALSLSKAKLTSHELLVIDALYNQIQNREQQSVSALTIGIISNYGQLVELICGRDDSDTFVKHLQQILNQNYSSRDLGDQRGVVINHLVNSILVFDSIDLLSGAVHANIACNYQLLFCSDLTKGIDKVKANVNPPLYDNQRV